MTLAHVLLLAVAGLVAGTLNAVAGGGSLVSFPALLAVGLPSVAANVTNTVALWPGYLGGALGYRRELAADRRPAIALSVTSLAGAVAGSVLLLTTPADVFTTLVPWLVLGATVLFAAQPRVAQRVRSRRASPGRLGVGTGAHLSVVVASVYGAYFGAGLGIILLAVLGSLVTGDLQRVNGLKNVLSLAINTVALLVFALFGPVQWLPVLVMAVASLVGGLLGARVARRLAPATLRRALVLFAVVVVVTLFARR